MLLSYEEVKHCYCAVDVSVCMVKIVGKSLSYWVKCRKTVTIGSMVSFVVGSCEFNSDRL